MVSNQKDDKINKLLVLDTSTQQLIFSFDTLLEYKAWGKRDTFLLNLKSLRHIFLFDLFEMLLNDKFCFKERAIK